MTRTARRLLALALLAVPASAHARQARPAAPPTGVPPGLDRDGAGVAGRGLQL